MFLVVRGGQGGSVLVFCFCCFFSFLSGSGFFWLICLMFASASVDSVGSRSVVPRLVLYSVEPDSSVPAVRRRPARRRGHLPVPSLLVNFVVSLPVSLRPAGMCARCLVVF